MQKNPDGSNEEKIVRRLTFMLQVRTYVRERWPADVSNARFAYALWLGHLVKEQVISIPDFLDARNHMRWLVDYQGEIRDAREGRHLAKPLSCILGDRASIGLIPSGMALNETHLEALNAPGVVANCRDMKKYGDPAYYVELLDTTDKGLLTEYFQEVGKSLVSTL